MIDGTCVVDDCWLFGDDKVTRGTHNQDDVMRDESRVPEMYLMKKCYKRQENLQTKWKQVGYDGVCLLMYGM
jgi:hypothetical protein